MKANKQTKKVTKLKKNYALTSFWDRWWIFNFRSSLDKSFNG